MISSLAHTEQKVPSEDHQKVAKVAEKVVEELLQGIKEDKTNTTQKQLQNEFRKKVGRPISDFLRLAYVSNVALFSDLQRGGEEELIQLDNDVFDQPKRPTNIKDGKKSSAEYHKAILIQVCKLIAGHDGSIDVNRTDEHDNSPLHLISSLSAISLEIPIIVGFLLDAGANPLLENEDGLNILHIIAGGLKAEEDNQLSALKFGRERVDAGSWGHDHRAQVLDLLSKNIPQSELAGLAGRHGQDENSLMHEWAIFVAMKKIQSANGDIIGSTIEHEIKIAEKFLQFGARIRTLNKFHLLPLHFAFHPSVYNFLVAFSFPTRNYQDETPFLFILKYFVATALCPITLVPEIQDYLNSEMQAVCEKQLSLEKAVSVLRQLLQLVRKEKEVKKMIGLADKNGVSALEVVLVCIRATSSYVVSKEHLGNLEILRKLLVEILNEILNAVSSENLREGNKKCNNPLHLLLDIPATEEISDDAEIITCFEVLVEHGFNVDGVDSENRTALHLTYQHHQQSPNLYERCAEILVKKGARMDLKDNSGKTVQDFLEVDNSNELIHVISRAQSLNQPTRVVTCHSKRYSENAKQLATATDAIIVGKKYRYKSDKAIGLGAFSCIFVAIEDGEPNIKKKSTKISCTARALKRLEKARINQSELRREVEVLLAHSTQCESIVEYYNREDDKDFYYICLELMDGDLQHFVSRRKVIESDTKMRPILKLHVDAALDIIRGVAYLHKNGILHRDIKPSNVLYIAREDSSLCFKIADFGFAKDVSPSHSSSSKGAMAPGTRCWMAPELVSLLSRKHTKESDVFSLGMVLHFLLTWGKHPFSSQPLEKEVVQTILINIVNMKLVFDKSLSEEAVHFIKAILVKDHVHKRPQASSLKDYPFLWRDQKKMKFLQTVGNLKYPNPALNRCLQNTYVGTAVARTRWSSRVPQMFQDVTSNWRGKHYDENSITDLLRFIRNVIAHKEGQTAAVKIMLRDYIFLKKFPRLLIDVYEALEKQSLLNMPGIQEVLAD